MYTIHKLKPDRDFRGLLIPFASLILAAFFGVLFSPKTGFVAIAFFFWAYAAYSTLTFFRTHNTGFLVVAAFQVSAGSLCASLPPENSDPEKVAPVVLFLALEIFFLVWMLLNAAARRTKWRGREVLELAAAPVEAVGNGYTPRPLPAGKIEFTQDQILEFSEFARRNLIAVPYLGEDKVVFVPVMTGREFGFIMGLRADYTDETWVAFSFDGRVSVNIAHRDYLEYKESLAFDQLCESLGTVFVEFLEKFQRGEGVRVIDRLNAVGISVFS